MPVTLNEPLSGLQKFGEMLMASDELLRRASVTKDPIKRHALAMISGFTGLHVTKIRKRKPFNPMLGETYEFVNDKFRLICEKVTHIPEQVVCFHQEGEKYTVNAYNRAMKPAFKFNGGKGMVEIMQTGAQNIHLKNTGEHISVSKPKILAKNLIWGGLYVDAEGKVESVCHETGSKGTLEFFEKKSNIKNSYLTGKVFDA